MGVFPVTPASLAAQPLIPRGHGGDTGSAPWLLPHQQSLRRGGVCRTHTMPADTVPVPEPREASVPGHCPGPPAGRPPAQARAGGRALSAGLPSLFRSAVTAASQSTEDGATGARRAKSAATLQARERRGRGGRTRPGARTRPGPGRPASGPARTGLGFQTRRQAAVPPPLSQDGAVATATKALARDGSRGRRTRGRRCAAEARSARRAGRREASAGAADGRTGRSARTRALEVSRRPTRHARPDGEGSGEGCAGPAGSHARRRCRGSEMPPSTVVTSPTAPLYWLPHPTPIAAVPKRSRRPAATRGSRGGFAGRADRPGAHGPRPASRGHYPLPPPFGDRRGDPGGRADGGPPRPTAGGGTPQARGRGQLGTGTRSHEKTRGPGRGDSGQTRSKPLQSRRLETFLQSG